MTKTGDNKRTVMICDDEEDILTVFSEVLKTDFNVLTAVSGQECIRKFAEEKKRGNGIDILLLDYKLDDMLGDEVATKLRGFEDLKIMLVTAYELDSGFVEDMKKKGLIIDALKKPISLKELIPRLKTI